MGSVTSSRKPGCQDTNRTSVGAALDRRLHVIQTVTDDYGLAPNRYGPRYDRKPAQDDTIHCLALELPYLLFIE